MIFGGNIPDLDYAAISRQLQAIRDESDALKAFFGVQWEIDVMKNPGALLGQLDEAIEAFTNISKTAFTLGKALKMSLNNAPALEEALKLAGQIKQIYPAPVSWLDDAADETNRADYKRWKSDLENRMREQKRLLEIYNERIIDEVNSDMLDRFRRGCRSFFRRFGKVWQGDQQLLKSLQTSPNEISRDAQLRSLEDALNIQRGRAEWLQDDSSKCLHLRERFPHFKPRSFEHAAETLERFTANFEAAVELRDNWNGSQNLLRILLTDQMSHDELIEASDKAHDAKESLNKALETIGRTDLIETSDAFAQAAEQAQAARPVLERLTDSAVSGFISACDITPGFFSELTKWVEDAARLRYLEEEEERESEYLQDAFGKRYQGPDTDWQTTLNALKWTKDVLNMVPNLSSDRLIRHIVNPAGAYEYQRSAEKHAESRRRRFKGRRRVGQLF